MLTIAPLRIWLPASDLAQRPRLHPVDTATGGVYLSRLLPEAEGHPGHRRPGRGCGISGDDIAAVVDEKICADCGMCTELCTYGALALHLVRGVMTADAVLCQGCWACAVACPSGAMNLHHFTFDQVMAQPDKPVDDMLRWPVREPELAEVEQG